MEYTSEGWAEIAEKVAPFAKWCGGFNWLTNEGEVKVLISADGLW